MARKSGRWRVPQGFDSGMRRDRSNGLKSCAARRLENRKSPEKRELKFGLARILTLAVVLAVSTVFWAFVPLVRLFDAFQPMVVALSVIIAAIFVRLNRGMPTLERKSLDRQKRTELTSRIVELSKEYVAMVAINGTALIALVTLVVVGKEHAMATLSVTIQKTISAGVGALFSLCLARMAYVVWRNCDIMELPKFLIDHVAERDAIELETKSADAKLAEMRAAGLRKGPIPLATEL